MTYRQIYRIALQQSAYDCNCRAEDFLSHTNLVVRSRPHPLARKYLPLPLECDLVSYGSNIVAQVSERLERPVSNYIARYPAAHCFETPNLHVLDDALKPHGLRVCFMAEYFLPDPSLLRECPCPYPLRVLTPDGFADRYTGEWSNALSAEHRERDVLAVGAYDGDVLVGLAGCSADCEGMYQIGVDVRPAYRRRGVACALTSRLAMEILAMGKVPFYCAAWSNIASVRNAIRSGFRPAWVELTAREYAFVEQINRGQ